MELTQIPKWKKKRLLHATHQKKAQLIWLIRRHLTMREQDQKSNPPDLAIQSSMKSQITMSTKTSVNVLSVRAGSSTVAAHGKIASSSTASQVLRIREQIKSTLWISNDNTGPHFSKWYECHSEYLICWLANFFKVCGKGTAAKTGTGFASDQISRRHGILGYELRLYFWPASKHGCIPFDLDRLLSQRQLHLGFLTPFWWSKISTNNSYPNCP